MIQKLGRGVKDLPPGIILKEIETWSRLRKFLNPDPSLAAVTAHSATAEPEGGA